MIELNQTKKQEFTVSFYQVQKDGTEFRAEADQVLRDLDLSSKVTLGKTKQIAQIVKHSAPWYEVIDAEGKRSWKPGHELIPAASDLGYAVLTSSENLRRTPDWKSETIQVMRPGPRLRILGYEENFVKVASLENPSLTGYLDLSHVITKLDFASFVLDQQGKWHPFLYRNHKLVVLADKQSLTWSQVGGYLTRSELGILRQPMPERGLVARSTVKIKKIEWVQWAESQLKGHGPVFWKKKERLVDSKTDQAGLTTEQILSKNVFAVAMHPKDPLQALIAANGIFFTRDGKSWQRLDSFTDENLPVAVSQKGELFVGGLRSVDQGKTFHPYLRWPDLALLMEERHQRVPSQLRVSEILPLGDQIQITVDTGSWKSSIVGSSRYGLVTQWRIIK